MPCCSPLIWGMCGVFHFWRKNGQRYSDSGGGRGSGDRGVCDPTFQNEKESSSVAGQLVARIGASALPGPGNNFMAVLLRHWRHYHGTAVEYVHLSAQTRSWISVLFGPKMCLLPGLARGSGTNAGWEAGHIVRQNYRRVSNFSSVLPTTTRA
jgi:hypothetical protein